MQRWLFVSLFFLIALKGIAQNKLPEVLEVVKKFYGQYSTQGLEYEYVAFEKKLQGWYVVTQHISGNKLEPSNRYLFFDQQPGKYNELPIEERNKQVEVDPQKYLDEHSILNFDLQLFYGYKECHTAVGI